MNTAFVVLGPGQRAFFLRFVIPGGFTGDPAQPMVATE
jgi:hypothetical protein